MATERSLQAIEPLEGAKQQAAPSRRVWIWIFIVGWFFGWPVVFLAGTSLISQPHWFYLFPIVIGILLWLISWGCIYRTLLSMAEARWPATKPIREIIGFIFSLLRSFHHSP